ncbi:MAG: O-antigen ligase family protein [Acidobacteriota bacterium]
MSVLHHSGVWVCYILFYVFARYFTDPTRGTSDFVILGIAIFLWLICLPPVIEYYSQLAIGQSPELGARYSKYTELANTAVPLVAAWYFRLSGKKAFFAIVTLVLMSFFSVSTKSRSGIILFQIGILCSGVAAFAFSSLRTYRKKALILVGTILLVTLFSNVALFVFAVAVPVIERVQDPLMGDSNRLRVLFLHVSKEMFAHRPLAGVGADNFGQEYTRFQALLAAKDPRYPDLQLTEDRMPERAHNEFAQIGAELGIVGLTVFAIFLVGIAFWGIRCLLQRDATIYQVTAFIGIGVFLLSSCVTSYSFRTLQNGFMFFLVLAVAVGHSIRPDELAQVAESKPARWYKISLALGLIGCAMLATLSVVRVIAVKEIIEAGTQPDIASSEVLFAKAEATDPENATIQAVIGRSLVLNNQPNDAIPHLRQTIELGRALTADYSYLATAQILAGQKCEAIATLEEGLRVYPLSVFLHTRVGALQNECGFPEESEAHFKRASEIDPAQAQTWRYFAESGGRIASEKAYQLNLPVVMDLKPNSAIYAMKDDRELRFPGEKLVLPQ